MKAKKILSAVLAAAMLCSAAITVNGAENSQDVSSSVTSAAETGLYAHGVLGNSAETEAWQCWQWNDSKNCFYFYLPSGADDQKVELYNNSANQAEFDGTVIEPYSSATVSYSTTVSSTAKLNGSTNKVKFMKSTAEAAIYLNNLNADGNGTGLWEYLSNDKENSASATSAIIGSDSTVDNTAVKKIKGRGNTTWYKDKKPFNVTFDARVSIAGMESGKKYSLLANYQDSSLSRNRFLYDLSDSVDMPYASDSRYVDFYVDGKYKGSYQATQKIDTGKGSLLSDIDEAGYMNPDGTFAENFAFVCEVDASAGDADYYFNSDSGNKITLKTPELDYGAEYYDRVLAYAKSKFDPMFDAIKNKVSNLNDYVDVESLAKIYLINELGKNWDSGVSSLYFTYKQDADGNWKFFASPVWDYDNSLGNATGVEYELSNMGVSDYEEPTGWWCKYKGGNKGAKTSSNIMFNTARNTTVMELVPRIWFEEFVPALNAFANNTSTDENFYSRDKYYSLISGSAEMNYTLGWQLYTSSWICDHSSLNICRYDYSTKTYSQDSSATHYDTNTFKGEFDYAADWMMSRAAWLSSQFASSYTPSYTLGDVNLDGTVNINDVSVLQSYLAKLTSLSDTAMLAADVDQNGEISILDATAIQTALAKL